MDQVMILNCSRPEIGLQTRTATYGEEYSIVVKFIEYYCNMFRRYNKKTQLAVFVEPRIDSGYPDMVFASYLPSIADNWTDNRVALDVNDLKLLSYLFIAQKSLGSKIITALGFPEKQTITSLEKLMDAKLVSYRNRSWYVRERRDVFSLTKLIAVEAKLTDVSKVVDQTHLNTRFASESYALTNSASPQSDTIVTFKKFGIGLYGKGTQFHRIVAARRHGLPSGYLSFQFNEWIGKSLALQGGTLYA